ncbi:YscG family type III secretion system chaperone [Photorhabdus africana]|uniref:YscG family type III secretion system chaperone n=1 Tax=Photorhabdus africana TaxID=3097554 RepID=UPI002B4101F8|nr:YscG family type III secretion system chaperone [Photorhabdus sp. CRI-LC]
MTRSLKGLLADIALVGSGHHCHDEANIIADWLMSGEEEQEAANLIRLSSLTNQGKYQQALDFGRDLPWPSLEPWLALCEWRLGLASALEQRLTRMAGSSDPQLLSFVDGMREQLAHE